MDIAISDGVWVILNWSCGLFHSDSKTNLISIKLYLFSRFQH